MVQIASHLARHLEEIALTVLPTSPESEEGMDDDSQLSLTDRSQRGDSEEPNTAAEQETEASSSDDMKTLFERHILSRLSRHVIFQQPGLSSFSGRTKLRTLEDMLFALVNVSPEISAANRMY